MEYTETDIGKVNKNKMSVASKFPEKYYYKPLVAIAFGLTGFFVNFFPVNFIIPPYKASLVIGLVFPLLISVTWGWRYGLISLVPGLGGQTMWFLWIPQNGWAPFVAIPVYNLWVIWHGWSAERRDKTKLRNLYISEIPFRILNTIIIYTLFSWVFRFNPSPWSPHLTLTSAPADFINFIAIKQAAEGVMILLLSDVLLNFQIFQKILLLNKKFQTRTSHIISASILFGLVFWLIAGLADYLFSGSKTEFLINNPYPSFADSVILNVPPHEMFTRLLFLITCLVAGLIISKYVLKFKERSIDLEKSEESYRTLVESMNDGMAVADRDNRLIYVNTSLTAMLGYTREEMIGHVLNDFFDEKNIEILKEQHQLLKIGDGKNYENEWLKKDGSRAQTILSPRALYDDEGNYNGCFSVITDITERKQSENEKAKLEAQLQQAQRMEAVGRLTGGIAHDFNNILSSIIGYSQIISSKLSEDDPLKEKIDIIHSAGVRAGELTRQLLAFSRKQVLEMKVININNLIINTVKMLERLIGEDVDLELITNSGNSNILADAGQIEQIIMNLVVNAKDAMPDGGRLVIETDRIRLDRQFCNTHEGLVPGEYIAINVIDSGTGIPDDIVDNIFDPFFTTKDIGEGTGLGLATVYGIVKQHKGYISVYSEKELGTTFKIFFPTVDEKADCTDYKGNDVMERGDETLLVVDDEPSIIKLLIDMLQPLGYKVHDASNGKEALDFINSTSERIDLMLTDVIMPGMNGRELADAMVQIRPEMKIIFMSGYTDKVIARKDVLEPGINFIHKPLVPYHVANKIRKTLDKKIS